jgi:hypothetical protein
MEAIGYYFLIKFDRHITGKSPRFKNNAIHTAAIFSLFEKMEDLKYDKLLYCRGNGLLLI